MALIYEESQTVLLVQFMVSQNSKNVWQNCCNQTHALPMLCHLAHIQSNQQMRKLVNLAFNYLWNNKPDKKAGDHIQLPEKAGGLGFPE